MVSLSFIITIIVFVIIFIKDCNKKRQWDSENSWLQMANMNDNQRINVANMFFVLFFLFCFFCFVFGVMWHCLCINVVVSCLCRTTKNWKSNKKKDIDTEINLNHSNADFQLLTDNNDNNECIKNNIDNIEILNDYSNNNKSNIKQIQQNHIQSNNDSDDGNDNDNGNDNDSDKDSHHSSDDTKSDFDTEIQKQQETIHMTMLEKESMQSRRCCSVCVR